MNIPPDMNPMAAAAQSMEALSLADQQQQSHSSRQKRPTRAYHNFYSEQQQQQQQPLAYPQQPSFAGGPGIVPTGSPFSPIPRNSSVPNFQRPSSAFSPYGNPAAAASHSFIPSLQGQAQQPQISGQNQMYGNPTQGGFYPGQSWNTPVQQDPGDSASNVDVVPAGIPRISAERVIADQKVNANPYFKTFENACPPAAGTDYKIVDQGLSGPQYTRLTMYNVPSTDLIRSSTKLPLGIVLRPFAPFSNLEYESGGVPVADFSQGIAPPRCSRCRTYMNPSMVFTEGGSRFICNMCQFPNPVPAEYYQPIDSERRRIDWHTRPELAFGTYDIVVPNEYRKFPDEEPTPLRYLFLIDVTHETVKRGLHTTAIEALRTCIYGSGLDPGDDARQAAQSANVDENGNPIPSSSIPIKFPAGAQIAIATFDRVINFYNLSPELEQAQAITVFDINEPFLPLEKGMFVDPEESRHVIESLFASVETMFDGNQVDDPVYGSVLEVAYQALEKTGGKVSVVLGSLPSYGPGAVALRDARTGFTGEHEKDLFVADNKFYKDLGKKYAQAGIGLDLFLFPQGLLEVSNIGYVSQMSGGHEHLYPKYIPERDARSFIADFCKTNHGEIGTQVSLKVRCSTGLQVSTYYGNFFHEEWHADPTIGTVDSNSTFGVLFSYDGKLDPKVDAHFQSAMLYTAANGQRRVRVNNVVAAIAPNSKATINFADSDAIVSIVARDNISRMGEFSLKELRLRLEDRVVDIFTAYRQYNNKSTLASQLLMPTTLRSLPAYLMSLQKSRPFRDQKLTSDTRVHFMRVMNSMSVDQLAMFLYPRIMGLHNLQDGDCTYNTNGGFNLPVNINDTVESIDAGGVYLVYNGLSVLMWIHRQVAPALLIDLFGDHVDALEKLNPNLNELPEIDTDVSVKARKLLKYLSNRSGLSFMGITIARQGLDDTDFDFQLALTEDPGIETGSYINFFSSIHNSVKNKSGSHKEKSAMSFISQNFSFGGGSGA